MSENSRIRSWLKLWPWLAAVLSGVLTTLCFAPFEQTWLCWIALTPLLAAVWFSGEGTRRRWLRDLLLGYVAGVVFFWGVFSWLHTVTVPGLILVGLYMGVYFAIWSWLAGLLRPRRSLPAPALRRNVEATDPSLTSYRRRRARPGSARFTISGSPSFSPPPGRRSNGFAAGCSAAGAGTVSESPLHDVLPIIQIAEITGVAGLSFVVAFANVIAVATVRRFMIESKVRMRRPHYDFTLTMAAIVGLCGYGIRLLQVKPVATEPLRVAAVQANVPRDEKFSRAVPGENVCSISPAHAVCPRHPAAAAIDRLAGKLNARAGAARRGKLPVRDGSLRFDQDGPAPRHDRSRREGRLQRGLARLERRREAFRFIASCISCPSANMFPADTPCPSLAQIVGDQVPADFTRGKEPVVFRLTTDQVKVAPLICFEDTLGELTRQFVLRGANLLAT